MKKVIEVSVFKGFTIPQKNVVLPVLLSEIKEGVHIVAVEKLRKLLREGKAEEAVRVKRQLLGFTLSATYSEKRRAEGMTGYNDILILDFDKLREEELVRCKEIIVSMPETLFCMKSPSGNGLKVGVRYGNEAIDQWRNGLFSRQEVTTSELEEYHKKAFEECRKYYEKKCGVEIDGSGSDIGRLCFVSYDPDIYIHTTAIERLEAPSVNIIATLPTPKAKSTMISRELPGDTKVCISEIPPPVQMEFQHSINYVQRNMKYEQGQRDTFIYTLGHQCYSRGIPQHHAELLTQHRFGGAPDIDIPRIIGNAYQYTSHTDRQEVEKQKPVAVKLFEFLERTVEVRRNVVLEQLEIRQKCNDTRQEEFRLIRKVDYNNAFLDAQYAGISCQPHLIHTVLDSRFAKDYNPFEEYFYHLPPWDMQTDYIDGLAQTLQSNNQVFWRNCFKRWLVGLVACALDEERENQLALIIQGDQGKGKSSWIRHLLPPELKQYYRNGTINPSNKDHMLLMSQRLLINLEEFEGMRKDEIAELKRLITQESITERKVYGEHTGYYIRRASFIASTNEPRFLEDTTGTRRFPTVTAEKIDYHSPVNHAGVYGQALHLWRNGFRYWYEEEEFKELYANNSRYVVTSQEEELFYVYYRKPGPRDYSVRWLPVSAILSNLTIYGKILGNKQSQRTLIKVLERDGFEKRVSENGIVEYYTAFNLDNVGSN